MENQEKYCIEVRQAINDKVNKNTTDIRDLGQRTRMVENSTQSIVVQLKITNTILMLIVTGMFGLIFLIIQKGVLL